jgi:outer membrane lipoprotein SlyB
MNIKLLMTILVIALLTGCATTTLQTQSKLTRTVTLDHSQIKNKTIYLQVTNTAGGGGENMQLKKNLEDKLKAKGYTLLSTSENADYGLFVNVLFSNNLKEAMALNAAMGYGTIGGVSSFAGGHSGRDALGAGIVMAIGAGIIGKALEDEIFRAIIDVGIREYHTQNIRTIKATSSGDAMVSSHQKDEFGGIPLNKDGYGDASSGIAQNTTQELEKNYEEHLTRVFTEAVKMNLKLDEALPILEEKASLQISNLF